MIDFWLLAISINYDWLQSENDAKLKYYDEWEDAFGHLILNHIILFLKGVFNPKIDD